MSPALARRDALVSRSVIAPLGPEARGRRGDFVPDVRAALASLRGR